MRRDTQQRQRTISIGLLPGVLVLVATGATAAEPAAHWDYGTKVGPAAWGQLSPDYAMCGTGKSQSPIDLSTHTTAAAPELKAMYSPATLSIVHHSHKADVVNTGHSIQVNYPEADTMTVGDESFQLLQYHFHSPSEHTIDGKHAAMEMHLVHKSSAGKLAVVGVMIEEGAENKAFTPIWKNLPKAKGDKVDYADVKVDVDELLPGSLAAYRYVGSLTTPPCSEDVKWFVLVKPVHMSSDQIGDFRKILIGNNRPTQPLNGRAVAKDAVKEKSAK